MAIKTYVPYAKHVPSDTLVHVDEVPNGLVCECVCVSCGAKLLAKNNGKVKVHHFAHANSEECPNYAKETLAHLLAKGIFVLTDQLYLPMPDDCYTTGYATCRPIYNSQNKIYQQDIFLVKNVRIEERDVGTKLIPDISCEICIGEQWEPLWIEICVRHPCDDQKIKEIKSKDQMAIEIHIDNDEFNKNSDYVLNHFFNLEKIASLQRGLSFDTILSLKRAIPVRIVPLHLPVRVINLLHKLKDINKTNIIKREYEQSSTATAGYAPHDILEIKTKKQCSFITLGAISDDISYIYEKTAGISKKNTAKIINMYPINKINYAWVAEIENDTSVITLIIAQPRALSELIDIDWNVGKSSLRILHGACMVVYTQLDVSRDILILDNKWNSPTIFDELILNKTHYELHEQHTQNFISPFDLLS